MVFTDEYSEVMSSIRHYSNLRYAILTVFVSLNAAIVVALFSKDALDPQLLGPWLSIVLRSFGLLTAITFWWIDFTLDGYMVAFGAQAMTLRPDSHWTRRPSVRKTLVVYAIWSLHLFIFLVWLTSIISMNVVPDVVD